jgi:hypothetical protein
MATTSTATRTLRQRVARLATACVVAGAGLVGLADPANAHGPQAYAPVDTIVVVDNYVHAQLSPEAWKTFDMRWLESSVRSPYRSVLLISDAPLTAGTGCTRTGTLDVLCTVLKGDTGYSFVVIDPTGAPLTVNR